MGESSQWTLINNSTVDSNIQPVQYLRYNNLTNAIAEHLSSASSLALLSANNNLNAWNWWFFLLAALYFIVVIGGVFGNASLIITLYTQSSARLRNPLLVAVCVADLFVSGIAAPISIVTIAMVLHQKSTWSPSTLACKSTHFLQVSENCYAHKILTQWDGVRTQHRILRGTQVTIHGQYMNIPIQTNANHFKLFEDRHAFMLAARRTSWMKYYINLNIYRYKSEFIHMWISSLISHHNLKASNLALVWICRNLIFTDRC